MKFVIQCTNSSSVTVDGKIVSQIERGFTVLVGIKDTDTREIADKMIKKMCSLRLFKDENGKTNLSLKDINGSILLVSQFTLYADCKSGNRPGFSKAGKPEFAKEIFDYIIKSTVQIIDDVKCGIFAAHMVVSLVNDGPFTIILDSDELFS